MFWKTRSKKFDEMPAKFVGKVGGVMPLVWQPCTEKHLCITARNQWKWRTTEKREAGKAAVVPLWPGTIFAVVVQYAAPYFSSHSSMKNGDWEHKSLAILLNLHRVMRMKQLWRCRGHKISLFFFLKFCKGSQALFERSAFEKFQGHLWQKSFYQNLSSLNNFWISS